MSIQCLKQSSSNTIDVNNYGSGNLYEFNGQTYDSNTKIGVTIGTYTITNVPTSYPIGFVIDNTDQFEVTGGTISGTADISGITALPHYSGNVVFVVKADFGTISYNSIINGNSNNSDFMGGEYNLIYSETCTVENLGNFNGLNILKGATFNMQLIKLT